MAKIEGFRIKNFRVLQDVTLGRLWNTRKVPPLTPMAAVKFSYLSRIEESITWVKPSGN
jgi:hypothetical protein